MADITTRLACSKNAVVHSQVRGWWLETVARVMTMLVTKVTWHAEIIVVAICALNKQILWKDCDRGQYDCIAFRGDKDDLTSYTAVAGAGLLRLWALALDLTLEGTRNLWLFLHWNRLSRRHPLRRTVDNLAILDEALDEPVAFT